MQKLVITDGLADSVSLSLTVYFSDGFQQTFSDLEDVISLENPSWCSITGLFVVTEGQSATISCQLGPRRQAPRVRVVGSERPWVYESCRRIRDRLQSMSVWGPPMRIYGPRSAGVSVVFTASLCVLFREHSVILTFPVTAVDSAQTPDRVCRYTWHIAALTCAGCSPHTTKHRSA
jgi:hypothetical protein